MPKAPPSCLASRTEDSRAVELGSEVFNGLQEMWSMTPMRGWCAWCSWRSSPANAFWAITAAPSRSCRVFLLFPMQNRRQACKPERYSAPYLSIDTLKWGTLKLPVHSCSHEIGCAVRKCPVFAFMLKNKAVNTRSEFSAASRTPVRLYGSSICASRKATPVWLAARSCQSISGKQRFYQVFTCSAVGIQLYLDHL